MEENEEVSPEIMIQPDQMAGTWANFARVSHSPYEFTLDFVRLDFAQQPPRGIVVSRVSVSPLFIDQLIHALQENWAKYAKKALPQEVYGGIQIPGIEDSGADDADSGPGIDDDEGNEADAASG